MITVNIDKILEEQNKSLYWLAQESGISYPTIHRLSSNKTSSISFDVLEKVCTVLDCSICDVLEIVIKQ